MSLSYAEILTLNLLISPLKSPILTACMFLSNPATQVTVISSTV